MKMMPVFRKPLSPRRSTALMTLGFVIVSAVLHLLLGGSLLLPWAQRTEAQHVSVVIFDRVQTPAPTPMPRRTPKPEASERPRVIALAPHKSEARPRKVVLPVRKSDEHLETAPPQVEAAASQPPATSAPAQPEADATPIDARDIIISARFIHRAEPDYPQLSIDRGSQGTVIVLVTIGPDGTPSDLRIAESSGDPFLDRAALEAARESTFAPPEVDGQPAMQTYRIIYTFYLD